MQSDLKKSILFNFSCRIIFPLYLENQSWQCIPNRFGRKSAAAVNPTGVQQLGYKFINSCCCQCGKGNVTEPREDMPLNDVFIIRIAGFLHAQLCRRKPLLAAVSHSQAKRCNRNGFTDGVQFLHFALYFRERFCINRFVPQPPAFRKADDDPPFIPTVLAQINIAASSCHRAVPGSNKIPIQFSCIRYTIIN